MKKILIMLVISLLTCTQFITIRSNASSGEIAGIQEPKDQYWFMLYRKSEVEKLYFGEPGNIQNSEMVKMFVVKTGIPGKKPTPLPSLAGRDYWIIVDKLEAFDNLETAPYFLTLDVPISEEEPYGPTPYLECDGQCNWELPGYFGLHGIAGDPTKLSKENEGSSGCIRHTDEDITYLYNLLDPAEEEIRYYIQDI